MEPMTWTVYCQLIDTLCLFSKNSGCKKSAALPAVAWKGMVGIAIILLLESFQTAGCGYRIRAGVIHSNEAGLTQFSVVAAATIMDLDYGR